MSNSDSNYLSKRARSPSRQLSNIAQTTSDDPTLPNMTSMTSAGSYALSKATEFVELHDQVQTSLTLLDSLETFLSTFQTDLSAVSGQISDLQARSKDIDRRLGHRRKIERPLASLLTDVCVPPSLANIILDTEVGDPWIASIADLDRVLITVTARSKVKAARDMNDMTEGLRIVASTKIRAFFLALLQPIRASVTTNMHVLQTSVFLKYQPLFAFVQTRAPSVATEVQRAYAGAARAYYETGFRRYIRALSTIRSRTTETSEPITTSTSKNGIDVDSQRLDNARLDGPAVTLFYMSDNKTYKQPVEALFRSLFLVLLDNASAEYTFITTFFAPPSLPVPPTPGFGPGPTPPTPVRSSLAPSPPDAVPSSPMTPDGLTPVPTPRARTHSISGLSSSPAPAELSKEDKSGLDALWKSIIDPVLGYTETFVKAILEPTTPPAVPLLTMIRLAEETMAEAAVRGCGPLERAIFAWRLQMWPVFQKVMSEHVEAVKKLAEGTAAGGMGGFFARATATTDALVADVCQKYIAMFMAMVTLTVQDEAMIFSNLLRLRQEVSKLIAKHTDKISDPISKATTQSRCYETLLQGLSKGASTHPKAQSEIAWWKEREEEARRRIRRGDR